MIDAASTAPPIVATRSLPMRSTTAPLICMPTSDPMPRTSSTVPVVALDIPTACFRVGKCTAHVDSTMPKEANNANTATRARLKARRLGVMRRSMLRSAARRARG